MNNRFKANVQAGGYTWESRHEEAIFRGKYVYVAKIKDYPDAVLVYTSDLLKVAWYDHIELTLGKSKLRNEEAYVVVIPRLKHGHMPRWYRQYYFDVIYTRRISLESLLSAYPDLYYDQWVLDAQKKSPKGRFPMDAAYIILDSYIKTPALASKIGAEGVLWAKLLVSYMDRNRGLVSGAIADFHANNIMFDGANKAYITDPCAL